MKPYLILATLAISFQFANPCSPENRGQKPEAGENAVAVQVVQATFQDQAQTVKTEGTVDFSEPAEIRATTHGRIEKLFVKTGDAFLANHPLFAVSVEETQMQIDLKSARLKEYQARLSLAQTKVENEGEEKQGTSNTDVEFLDEEQADEPIEKNFENTPHETPQTQRALAVLLQTLVDKLKLEIEILEKQKNELTVLAPFNGIVLNAYFIEGNEIKTQDSVLKVAQTEPLSVSFSLPQDSVNFINKQSSVEVYAPHTDQNLGMGTVYFISPSLDASTQNLPLKAHVSNPDFSIKTGQTLDVVVKTSKMNRVITLPETALIKNQDKNFIFIVIGHKASLIELQDVQVKEPGTVEVKVNLSVDDRIINNPPSDLKNGDFVKIDSPAPSIEKR